MALSQAVGPRNHACGALASPVSKCPKPSRQRHGSYLKLCSRLLGAPGVAQEPFAAHAGFRFERKERSMPRELIDTGTDKRFVRRDEKGQFKESDDVGRSLSADRRRKAQHTSKKGEGDLGDRWAMIECRPRRATTPSAGRSRSETLKERRQKALG